jgi:phenylpyruvate tautomerase PptA (4-oxalocrotonate tautomerase family)
MPYLQLDVPSAFAVPSRTELAGELIGAYADCMQTDTDRVSVGFRDLGPDGVLRRIDGELRPSVVLTCDIRAGRPAETIAAFIDAVTALLAARLEIAPPRVAVYITEHAATEIARGGRVTTDWSAAER